MKKTLAFMIMAAALLLTQCKKPSIKFPTPSVTTTVSMTITAGPGSKTDITTEGGIVWSENDKIYVGDGSKYVGYLTIVSGMGNATGTFTGEVTAGTGDDCTFHFYYLGNAKDYSTDLASHNTSVEVDFSSQNIYEENGKLKNASGQHVGYGKAEHVKVEADKPIMGLEVSMKSKVAIAYFCFQKGEGERANPYTGALTLSGTNIYNKMTVNFSANDFSFSGTKGDISLANTTTHLKYAMLVPAGTSAATLNFIGGAGTTVLENGIEANKFYRVDSSMPIVVTINAYVDFGLSVKWATCNLGASSPEEYGDYYAWGATETWYSAGGQTSSPTWKPDYSKGYRWVHCPHTNGTYSDSNTKVFTKYVLQSQASTYGDGDFYDNKTVLDASDDAASANLGTGWRMPTTEEWKALYDNTTNAWTDNYNGTGVAGLVFTSKDGKGTTLFLPAAGYRYGTTPLRDVGSKGYYWSSSLYSSTPINAYIMLYSDSGDVTPQNYSYRYYGYIVRPVR